MGLHGNGISVKAKDEREENSSQIPHGEILKDPEICLQVPEPFSALSGRTLLNIISRSLDLRK